MAYIKFNHKSQSLLELAVFGALLIGLLSTLISYGLRNKFQQQALQQTFRKAMAATHEKVKYGSKDLGRRGQATYIYVRDRHTPDPTNPFGTGTVSPYIQGATIVRDFKLNETARYDEELPIIIINIPSQAGSNLSDKDPDNIYKYRTAGFADKCVPKKCPEGPIKKYEEIYGYSNFWKVRKKDRDDDGGRRNCPGAFYGINFNSCPSENSDPIPCNVTTDGVLPEQASREGYVYRAIDYCEGEIMNYDACKMQCGKFKDPIICKNECVRSRMDWSTAESACERICEANTEVPWYCSQLDTIFPASAGTKPKDLGLQQDYTVDSTRDNVMKKAETGGVIKTTDTLNRSDTITRDIVIIRNRSVERVPVENIVSGSEVIDLEAEQE